MWFPHKIRLMGVLTMAIVGALVCSLGSYAGVVRPQRRPTPAAPAQPTYVAPTPTAEAPLTRAAEPTPIAYTPVPARPMAEGAVLTRVVPREQTGIGPEPGPEIIPIEPEREIMPSITRSGNSIMEAIEKAWNDAGQPDNFSITILDKGELGFMGLTIKRQASVAISFQPTIRDF